MDTKGYEFVPNLWWFRSNQRLECMTKPLQMSGHSNLCSNLLKTRRVLLVSPKIHTRWRLILADIEWVGFVVMGGESSLRNWGIEVASMVEMRGRRRAEERQRCRGSGGVATGRRGKKKGLAKLYKCPSSIIFFGPKLLDT